MILLNFCPLNSRHALSPLIHVVFYLSYRSCRKYAMSKSNLMLGVCVWRLNRFEVHLLQTLRDSLQTCQS